MEASNSDEGTKIPPSSDTDAGVPAPDPAPAPDPVAVVGIPPAATLPASLPASLPATLPATLPPSKPSLAHPGRGRPPGQPNKFPPGYVAKVPPVSAGGTKKKKRGPYQKKDTRLEEVNLHKLERVPPLSMEIPFLTDKLAGNKIPFFFRHSPEDVDWDDATSIKSTYPPLQGYGEYRPPLCLLQDAATPQDKLIVVNWWRFLHKEQQKQAHEELRNIYAAPKFSNRLLPPDFWERMKQYDTKRMRKLPQPKKAIPIPTDRPLSPRVYLCRGWKGAKYDPLFRPCLMAEITKSRSSMQGSGTGWPESIPIPESISKSKYAADLHFVLENNGDDYVFRSRSCKKVVAPPKKPTDNVRFLCESCNKWCALVAELRVKPIRNPAVADLNVVIEKQKAEIRQLKCQIKNSLRREERRKQRSERDAEFTARVELDKRQNAAQSLTVLYNRKGNEDSDNDNDEVDHYNTFAHPRTGFY